MKALLRRRGASWDDVVFVDETFFKTNMIPRYGWSKRGVPLVDRSSYSYWKTLSCICCISNSQVFALQTFEGGTTNEKFAAYVEQVLLPELRPNSIVVTDNLSAHKQAKIREILARKNCVPFFTPTYSPDFSGVLKLIPIAKRAPVGR